MSSVVICEKPSQARNLRLALGDRYGRILAAQGHLLRLESPEEVNETWKAWGLDVLRPAKGRYGWRPDEGNGKAERLEEIRKALGSAGRVIIATDCDREGQAIGESLVRYLGFKGEVLRAMFTAEDETSLQAAFAALKPNAHWSRLFAAAVARAQSDQIFNLTLTRAVTVKLRPAEWRGPIGIGRVRTPTLGLVCARELEIRNFTPRDFFEIEAVVTGSAGASSLWFRPRGERRIFDPARADLIALAAASYEGPIEVSREARKTAPPRPFDLPSLQKHAGRWGWSAKKVLDVAQALYEQHKLITYPRAETRYLPENLVPSVGRLMDALREVVGLSAQLPAEPIIRRGKAGLWSDAGIAGASHHALIPNVYVPSMASTVAEVTPDERTLFEAIARAFIASISPDHEFDETTLSFSVGVPATPGEVDAVRFQAQGRVVTQQGWKAVLANEEKAEDDDQEDCASLPAFANGDTVTCTLVRARRRQTVAPKRYTEGDLIDAMHNAWRFVKDEAERERLKEAKGIGTPATRDSILEGLKRQGMLVLDKKHLVPSDLALWLYGLLCGSAPALVDPGATARMEARLDDVLAGTADADAVIGEITELTSRLVTRLGEVTPPAAPTIKRPPSRAMLSAAKDKAKRERTRLPRGAEDDAEICRAFLGPRRQASAGPSDKQLAYAQKLSQETGMDLPEAARLDAVALSKWIDAARSAGGKDLASPKQREWIAKLVGEGAKPPRGYPDRIDAKDARAFLDKAFGKKAARR